MKHVWQEPELKTPADRFATYLSDPMRVCLNCGAKQTRVTEYLWMRVTGYRWLPLVGRCKPLPTTDRSKP